MLEKDIKVGISETRFHPDILVPVLSLIKTLSFIGSRNDAVYLVSEYNIPEHP